MPKLNDGERIISPPAIFNVTEVVPANREKHVLLVGFFEPGSLVGETTDRLYRLILERSSEWEAGWERVMKVQLLVPCVDQIVQVGGLSSVEPLTPTGMIFLVPSTFEYFTSKTLRILTKRP